MMGGRKLRFWIKTGAFAAVILLTVMLTFVTAPAPPSTPPSSNTPVSLTNYGVTDVYGAVQMSGGTTNIQIYTVGNNAPFFVEKILLMLQTPGQSDIVLQTVTINGVQSWSYATYNNQPRVTLVPQGTTMGDIISSLPSSLSLLMVKDPLGNQALFGSGETSGLTFGIGYSTPLVGGGVSVLALVVAPSNSTVTLNIS
jgi:predicted small integral membrane protein